jgi:hypothetical protein
MTEAEVDLIFQGVEEEDIKDLLQEEEDTEINHQEKISEAGLHKGMDIVLKDLISKTRMITKFMLQDSQEKQLSMI